MTTVLAALSAVLSPSSLQATMTRAPRRQGGDRTGPDRVQEHAVPPRRRVMRAASASSTRVGASRPQAFGDDRAAAAGPGPAR